MDHATKSHWQGVYGRRALTELSWYEPHPSKSLELIRETGIGPDEPVIDVGCGTSFLVDILQREGFRDLSVLDISSEALSKVRERLGPAATHAVLIESDVTAFQPPRQYSLWHDRAVFHFLVQADDRKRYVDVLTKAVRPEGHLIIGTFGPQGPERCSGLEVVRYSASSLTEALGNHFRLVHSSLDQHTTPTGKSQQFLYCRYQRV